MSPATNSLAHASIREDGLLRSLGVLAHEANDLAKLLKGSPLQRKAYGLKNRACSALLTLGGAVVNSRQMDHDLYALDILCPPSQIHCRRSQLGTPARIIADEQATSALPKSAMRDRLRPDQLEQIAEIFPSKRRAS